MSRNYSSTAVDTTLTSGVAAANTTLAVASTTGFPAAPFVLAVDAGAASQELVLVTAVGGLSLTVTRGYDSTVAATHEAGAVVSHSHAAIDFREAGATKDAYDAHAAATAAHGATGAVVGTTNTQTLTNKTLTAPTLTAPVATGSLTGLGGAWTAWNPTITASSGTFTTVSGAGRYEQRGKTVQWSLTITITTVGTASGYIVIPLPVNAQAATGYVGTGRVLAGAPSQLVQAFLSSASQARVSKYDDTGAIGAGYVLHLSGTYEAA